MKVKCKIMHIIVANVTMFATRPPKFARASDITRLVFPKPIKREIALLQSLQATGASNSHLRKKSRQRSPPIRHNSSR
ncbi:hypothetical protein HDF10_000435 [Edaphobacter lichenicola]|uniref:Uncharacterized protein n=1 Tax=Tunturiibacter lichenicola TaxID=2051959 RepID=A0A7W8N432_9BACT|nr:hypothetical protein [Edaphobacter lichenicola]